VCNTSSICKIVHFQFFSENQTISNLTQNPNYIFLNLTIKTNLDNMN
jgi:hypothetical protein